MSAIPVFIFLQVLDFITTMIGFKVGAKEASPFIAKLIHITSPAWGVAASKVLGLAIAGACLIVNRARLVKWINYWYGAVVVWNIGVILKASGLILHS